MKQRIVIVVATALNNVIGLNGQMPWHLPEDLAHFKKTTMGSTLIMGRKTFESIGRALPGRRTIVVSRNTHWQGSGAETCADLPSALKLASLPARIRTGSNAGDAINLESVYVVGGGEIYAQTLPLAQEIIRTEIGIAPVGDTFFPELSPGQWQLVKSEPHLGATGLNYSIQTWHQR